MKETLVTEAATAALQKVKKKEREDEEEEDTEMGEEEMMEWALRTLQQTQYLSESSSEDEEPTRALSNHEPSPNTGQPSQTQVSLPSTSGHGSGTVSQGEQTSLTADIPSDQRAVKTEPCETEDDFPQLTSDEPSEDPLSVPVKEESPTSILVTEEENNEDGTAELITSDPLPVPEYPKAEAEPVLAACLEQQCVMTEPRTDEQDFYGVANAGDLPELAGERKQMDQHQPTSSVPTLLQNNRPLAAVVLNSSERVEMSPLTSFAPQEPLSREENAQKDVPFVDLADDSDDEGAMVVDVEDHNSSMEEPLNSQLSSLDAAAVHSAKDNRECSVSPSQVGELDKNKNESSASEDQEWTCKMCCKSFRNFCDLGKHQKMHFSNGKWMCFFCDKTFTHFRGLKRHIHVHFRHEDKSPTLNSVVQKSLSNTPVSGNVDPVQNISSAKSGISASTPVVDGDENASSVNNHEWKCICDKSFRTRHGLENHQKTLSIVGPLKCCGVTFKHPCTLTLHRKKNFRLGKKAVVLNTAVQESSSGISVSGNVEPVETISSGKSVIATSSQCTAPAAGDENDATENQQWGSLCDRTLANPCELTNPRKIHLRHEEKAVTSNAIAQQSSSNTPVSKDVQEKRKWMCSICDKSFLSFAALEIHGRTHFNSENRMCSVFDETYSRVFQIIKNEKVQHRGGNIEPCSSDSNGLANERGEKQYNFRKRSQCKNLSTSSSHDDDNDDDDDWYTDEDSDYRVDDDSDLSCDDVSQKESGRLRAESQKLNTQQQPSSQHRCNDTQTATTGIYLGGGSNQQNMNPSYIGSLLQVVTSINSTQNEPIMPIGPTCGVPVQSSQQKPSEDFHNMVVVGALCEPGEETKEVQQESVELQPPTSSVSRVLQNNHPLAAAAPGNSSERVEESPCTSLAPQDLLGRRRGMQDGELPMSLSADSGGVEAMDVGVEVHNSFAEEHLKSQHLFFDAAVVHSETGSRECSILPSQVVELDKNKNKDSASEDRKWMCKVCPMSFRNLCDLVEHRKTHFRNGKWMCCFCDKTFAHSSRLNIHRQTHLRHNKKAVALNTLAQEASSNAPVSENVQQVENISSDKNVVIASSKDIDPPVHDLDNNGIPKYCKLKCYKCDMYLRLCNELEEDRKKHLSSQPNSRKLLSTFCDKNFGYLYQLASHMKTHFRRKENSVENVEAQGSSSNIPLSANVVLVENISSANSAISSSSECIASSVVDSPELHKWACTLCDKSFRNICDLKEHHKVHFNNGKWLCYFCDRPFSHLYGLMNHKRTCRRHEKHSVELKAVAQASSSIAPSCGSVTPASSEDIPPPLIELDSDENEDNALEIQKWMCSICDKKFSSYISLMMHRRNHFNRKSQTSSALDDTSSRVQLESLTLPKGKLKCFKCGDIIATVNEAMDHVKQHFTPRKASGKPVDSKEVERGADIKNRCNEDQFCSKGPMMHLRTCKAERKCSSTVKKQQCFECDKCKKTYKRMYLLRLHMQAVCFKSSSKNFQCNKCSKWFADEELFTYHTKRHSKQKVHQRKQCEICGKTFRHLEVHMKTHTSEKDFVCDDCGESFRRKHHLENHMRKHTGERPYKCEECGDCFKTTGHLINHRETHKPPEERRRVVRRNRPITYAKKIKD